MGHATPWQTSPMADKQSPDDGPSLEMPSLGSLFRRNKKSAKAAEAGTPDVDTQPSAADFEKLVRGEKAASGTDGPSQPEEAGVEAPAAERSETPVSEAVGAESADAEAVSAEAVGAESAPGPEAEVATPPVAAAATAAQAETPVEAEAPAAAPPAEPERLAEPERVVTATEHEGASAVEGTVAVESAAPPADLPEHDLIDPDEEPDLEDLVDDRPEAGATGAPVTDTALTDTAVIESTRSTYHRAGARAATTDAGTAAAAAGGSGGGVDVAPGAPEPGGADDADAAAEGEARAKPSRSLPSLNFSLPALDGRIAAAIAGLVVGALAVVLTWGGMEGCEAVRGTSSCGGSGIGILVVIMVVLVLVGGAMLAAWKVTDPNSTSFLAVGLLAVVALLFLMDVIFEKSMIVVIPLVSVATYLLSHFVTTRFIEEE